MQQAASSIVHPKCSFLSNKQTDTQTERSLYTLRTCTQVVINYGILIYSCNLNRAGANDIITTLNDFRCGKKCMVSLQNSSDICPAVSMKYFQRCNTLTGECRYRSCTKERSVHAGRRPVRIMTSVYILAL